jgi:hypothetical protein
VNVIYPTIYLVTLQENRQCSTVEAMDATSQERDEATWLDDLVLGERSRRENGRYPNNKISKQREFAISFPPLRKGIPINVRKYAKHSISANANNAQKN